MILNINLRIWKSCMVLHTDILLSTLTICVLKIVTCITLIIIVVIVIITSSSSEVVVIRACIRQRTVCSPLYRISGDAFARVYDNAAC